MSQVIAITSGKGGVGKSTICVGLGYAFSTIGKKTLIVELDIGLRGLDIMLGVENQIVYDLGDILNRKCEIEQAVVGVKDFSNLGFIAASSNIDFSIDVNAVVELCNKMKKYFDYVILDMPAGIGINVNIAARVADLVLIVATPDPVCIRDGNKIALVLKQNNIDNMRLIINKASLRNIKSKIIKDLDDVIDGVGVTLIGVVSEDLELQTAFAKGQCLDNSNKNTIAFKNIAKRIGGEYVPLCIC